MSTFALPPPTKHRSAYDYNLYKVGSYYFAQKRDGSSTSDSALHTLLNSIVASNISIHFEDGDFYLTADVPLVSLSKVFFDGEGSLTTLYFAASAGFSISHNVWDGQISDISFSEMNMDGQSGTADYCIRATGMGLNCRLRRLRLAWIVFTGFYKANVYCIDIYNPEQCFIEHCSFDDTIKAFIHFVSYCYEVGNSEITHCEFFPSRSATPASAIILENLNQYTYVQLASAGYTNCVAGDVGKQVRDDGVEIGALVSYDNSQRVWGINTTSTIAKPSAMTITGGTGAGTTSSTSAGYEGMGMKTIAHCHALGLKSASAGYPMIKLLGTYGDCTVDEITDVYCEDIELLHCVGSTYGGTKNCDIHDCKFTEQEGGLEIVKWDANTANNCMHDCSGTLHTPSKLFEDLCVSSIEGNSVYRMTFNGDGGYTQSKVTRLSEVNVGNQRLGKATNPFYNLSVNKISSEGLGSANPTTAKEYVVYNADCFITSSGGTVSDITIKDANGNTLKSGVTTLDNYPMCLGWKITWTHTGAPTVTIVFKNA